VQRSLGVASLLALVLAVSVGAEDAPEYRYSVDFTRGHADTWTKHLGRLVGRADARGLEIGCFEGGSTLWFLQQVLTHPNSRMTCIDVFTEEIEANFDHNVRISGQADRIVKHKGYSQDVLRGLEPESFDFVYIDGCHLASCVLTDAVLSWDLLKPDGILIFDDYMFGATKPASQRPQFAIDAFLEVFSDQIELEELGLQVIVRKKTGRNDKDLVGEPLVHDPAWLKRVRQRNEWIKRRRQQAEPKQQAD